MREELLCLNIHSNTLLIVLLFIFKKILYNIHYTILYTIALQIPKSKTFCFIALHFYLNREDMKNFSMCEGLPLLFILQVLEGTHYSIFSNKYDF